MNLEIDPSTATPEQLQELFNQVENGETPEPTKVEPAQAATTGDPAPANTQQGTNDNQQQATASTEQAPAANGAEKDAEGVATKDGKHIIPFSVLKSERDRAARAETMLLEAQQQLANLQQQASASQTGANNGEGARTTPAVEMPSDQDLAELKEDFPSVYKAFTAVLAKTNAVADQLKPVEQSVRSAEADAERQTRTSVQDAIDATPKLAHIQATDAKAFELAKQFDAVLRSQDEWSDKSLSERFAKVVEMVEASRGPINLPSKSSPPSAEELKAQAQAAAAAAARKANTAAPTSLSEFPAGQAPATSEKEAAQNMTHQQLAEKFAAMTPEQMDAWVRSL